MEKRGDHPSFEEMKEQLWQEAIRRNEREDPLYLIVRKSQGNTRTQNPRGCWEILSEQEYHRPSTPGYMTKIEWYSDEGGWRLTER